LQSKILPRATIVIFTGRRSWEDKNE